MHSFRASSVKLRFMLNVPAHVRDTGVHGTFVQNWLS
jgi:hypothetical protein